MNIFGFTIIRTKFLEEIARDADTINDDLRGFLKYDADREGCYYDADHLKICDGLRKVILKLVGVLGMTEREARRYYL